MGGKSEEWSIVINNLFGSDNLINIFLECEI